MNNQVELSIKIEKVIEIKTSVRDLGGDISMPGDVVDELEKAHEALHRAVEDSVMEIIGIIQERITFSESKVKEDTVENRNRNSFWEGQIRCAQALMNEIQDRYFREENK